MNMLEQRRSNESCHFLLLPSISDTMVLLLQATIIFAVFLSVENSIYLYHTHDGSEVEFFDCVYAESLWYCRRPTEPMHLTRDKDASDCEKNGAITHRFSDLRSNGISVSSILHEWQSSIERVEQYVRFLRDDSQTDGYLCQCTDNSSFGRNCEYQLPHGESFPDVFAWQRDERSFAGRRLLNHIDILCYQTLNCDSGLLCLDWREICDGIQQCMFGYDEENCDLLELNICDDDEYRCMNGMCIPDEYFLDGQFDCLDWSDEMQDMTIKSCTQETASTRCDDHVCPPNQWPCGDGQCTANRLPFGKSSITQICNNHREFYFTCETSPYGDTWTKPDGRCHYGYGGRYEEVPTSNLSSIAECEYLLRCALSEGGEINCPCGSDSSCAEALNRSCSLSLISYPRQPLIAPHLIFLYNRSRDTAEKLPSVISINGTIRCRNALVPVNGTMLYSRDMTIDQIMNDLCSSHVSGQSSRCHNEKDSIDVCQEWNACMSRTRLNDGFVNCLNGRDETEKSSSCDHRHRFRCSAEQPTCLSVMVLGDGTSDCANRFDEHMSHDGRKLSEMECHEGKTSDCVRLRRYVEQSWTSSRTDQMTLSHRIRFRSYCDTFWDSDKGRDENVNECRRWWICATGYWRCETEQCSFNYWWEDDEWDCADGSDERGNFIRVIEWIQERALTLNISKEASQLIFETCSETRSFICLSAQTSHRHVVCLNQSQLGDQVIDCLGGIDERNTLPHCSQTEMLGNNFKCASSDTCIPYHLHCRDDHRCPNQTDDAHWCSWRQKRSDCEGETDFVCFDDQCVKGGRCKGNVQCVYGEDEYMCDDRRPTDATTMSYRQIKRVFVESLPPQLHFNPFPSTADCSSSSPQPHTLVVEAKKNHQQRSTPPFASEALRCNRGIVMFSINRSSVCFCSPQYYGDQCQYHADRLLVLFYLRLSQPLDATHYDENTVIKLLVLFLYNTQTLMTHEFHVRPTMKMTTFTKEMIHFLYSHWNTSQQQRRQRYFNRSDIIASQPYSIHIEAYEYYSFNPPSLIAVWRYPIHFDYLPVYRFAKVLHLIRLTSSSNPCTRNPCHQNEECHQLMNNRTRNVCLCKMNRTGPNCSLVNEQCVTGYCAGGALCKPHYRGSLRGAVSLPYCICPPNRYGDRCDVEHDACRSNPCLNDGTCYPSSQPNQTVCACHEEYYGDECASRKAHINLTVATNLSYVGAVIQFFDYDPVSLTLILADQRVYSSLPGSITYDRDDTKVPAIVSARLYSSSNQQWADIYLFSLQIEMVLVVGETEISETNRCPHVSTLVNGNA